MMNYSRILIAIFAILISGSAVFAQPAVSGARDISGDAEKIKAKLRSITDNAGIYFKQGLINLKDQKRLQARADFDKSVRTFLESGVNVRVDAKLQGCYDRLIETIFRIEFPSARTPQIKELSTTCGWALDNETESIAAQMQQPSGLQTLTGDSNSNVASTDGSPMVMAPQMGFQDQKYEISPLDQLATLELNQTELNVATPEAQASEQYIKVALSHGSLGFNFQFHALIQQYINYYQGRGKGTMETGLYRSGMFMRMARRIFREEGVPENVAWLGQVESAWKPTAHSWAAAAGLWQFIPGTGTRFGLRQNAYIDERQSFEKATRASAQYLKFLANRYGGDWPLALAAYNSGEGNVDRAINRAGGQRNFWAAYPYLPRETKNYVPNILATILIANDPHRYGFGNVRPAAQLAYDQVRVPASTSLSLIAQASDSSVEYLRYLNPELRQNVTPPEPYIVRVLPNKANSVVAVLKRVPANNRSTAMVTSVAAGENWQAISNRTGISVEQLQAANNGVINPQGGGKVVIPKGVKQTAYVRANSANTPTPVTGSVQVVKAKAGDTVRTVAGRHKVSAVDLAKFNGLTPDAKLLAGREIKIPAR